MPRDIALVIFDCDGVLIDSEYLACRIEAEVLTAHGFPLTTDEVRDNFLGLSLAREVELLTERFGRKPSPEAIAAMHDASHAAFEAELEAVPGIHHLLDRLRVPCCVASSSSPERLRHTLGLTGLYDRLQPHIFSATMVKHGKPAPDLFLHAASAMRADPQHCLVIEDSAAGVQAGKAAGMMVIGFVGGKHCPDGHDRKLTAAGADRIAGHMDDIFARI